MGFQKIKKKLFPLALLVMMVILAATVAMAKSAAPIEDTGITGVVSGLREFLTRRQQSKSTVLLFKERWSLRMGNSRLKRKSN